MNPQEFQCRVQCVTENLEAELAKLFVLEESARDERAIRRMRVAQRQVQDAILALSAIPTMNSLESALELSLDPERITKARRLAAGGGVVREFPRK